MKAKIVLTDEGLYNARVLNDEGFQLDSETGFTTLFGAKHWARRRVKMLKRSQEFGIQEIEL